MNRRPLLLAAAALALGTTLAAQAAPLVVIASRSAKWKPGQKFDSAQPLQLAAGEQVTAIGADGRTVTLTGPFSGAPAARAAAANSPRQALAALIATRAARSSAVGTVRGGAGEESPLPQPWLVDISRPGPRCLRAGETPVWWRPDAKAALPFTVFPLDRSWRADFAWQAGQAEMHIPPFDKLVGDITLVIRSDGDEQAITIYRAPANLDNAAMLAGWMIQRGCGQQADALLSHAARDSAS